MDFTQLQQTLRQFAAERDWAQFHTPKNLAMALMVEVAELAEIFPWMTPEQSRTAHGDVVVHEHIGDEVADVLLYLLQLADHSAIDLERAVERKLARNATKHPPTRFGLPSGPVAPLPVACHVLVDWENVQPKGADIKALVPDVSDVWIFHGVNQKKADANQGAFGENLTMVPVTRPGKNALDFHLSFYMGYITSRNPGARIVVISNDLGYGPMLGHARDLGFAASQLGFGKPTVRAAAKKGVAKQTPARKTPAKKAPARKATAKKVSVAKKAAGAPQTKPASPTSKAAAKTAAGKAPTPKVLAAVRGAAPLADKDFAHVVDALHKNKNKPTRRVRLVGMVKSLLNGGKAEASVVEQVVARLVDEGHVLIDEKGAVSMGR
jgi:NTP pyrophosphatase (non-canonical NTP hydrolase)